VTSKPGMKPNRSVGPARKGPAKPHGMFWLMLLSVVMAGCAGHFEVRKPLDAPFDALIVPGCPTLPDGSLSLCLQRRAVWASLLWERGQAGHFITSGAAVRTPFVEAEALALTMHALGVPADRIYVEPDALHTDENVFNSLRIAQKKGFTRLGVASERSQALGACQMLSEWHQKQLCGAFSMETSVVEHRRSDVNELLSSLRAKPVADFVPLEVRERDRAKQQNRRPRPHSAVLYPLMTFLRVFGKGRWQPFHPPDIPLLTWADHRNR